MMVTRIVDNISHFREVLLPSVISSEVERALRELITDAPTQGFVVLVARDNDKIRIVVDDKTERKA